MISTGYVKRAALAFMLTFFAAGCGSIDLSGSLVFKATKDGKLYIAAINKTNTGNIDFKRIYLPEGIMKDRRFRVINCFALDEKRILLATRQHGLWITPDMGTRWTRHDTNLPREMIYPFEEKHITKPVRSISVSRDRKTILCLMPKMLLLSVDGGRTFTGLPLKGIGHFAEMLTAQLHPEKPSRILIGTSTMGLYYSVNAGKTVKRITRGCPGEPVGNPNFNEEVRSLCFDPDNDDLFYAGFAMSRGVYRGSLSGKHLTRLDVKGLYTYPDGNFCSVNRLVCHGGILYIGTTCEKNFRLILDGGKQPAPALEKLFSLPDLIVYQTPGDGILTGSSHHPVDRPFQPSKKCMGKRGLYISYGFTRFGNYPKLIRLLKELRLNAVVINLKDDYGVLRVPTDDKTILQVPDSCKPYKDVKKTIRRLREDGIYVIGRLVVFKDKRLYSFDNYKYAVKYPSGAPLLKGPEKWVDIFSDFVWDYNIAMAKAIEDAGVDEIQFDYIRSPDLRGKRKGKERYDFQRPGMIKREALASFLKKARQELKVPISMDSFGFDSMYQTNWIGQDISTLANYIDVLSPMFYPSHYTGGYGRHHTKRGNRIYYMTLLSCKRAVELTNGVHMRPYLQAFYYKDNWDEYGVDYIGWELKGLKDAGLKDCIFWNDLSEYKILIRGLWKHYGILKEDNYRNLYRHIPKKPNPRQFKKMVESARKT